MSLDNAIVIATIASKSGLAFPGEVALVIFALLFSFPIILFGASLLTTLIDKYKFVIYIFAFLLIHVGLEMILKDPLLHEVHSYLENGLMSYVIWIVALIILIIKVMYERQQNK